MLINFLKKIAIVCFTGHPYRMKKFCELYAGHTGQAVDHPESLSAILRHEPGETSTYKNISVINPQWVNNRYIDKKPRFKSSGVFKSPDRYLYSMSDACIIGQLGLIYDPGKRCFIDESAKEWIVDFKKSLYANSFSLPQKVFLKGITCSYLTLGADGGFYHFLFESVIKTEMYRSVLKQADHILFNGPLTDWKLKWVNKANIDCSKIIWVEGNAHYQCEQLLFTNKLIADQQVSKWAVNTLKEVFGISDTGNNKSITKNIIWITRKGQKNREIEWEYELLKQFPAIAKLQYATHVIGPHGAGLSNIYLCRPGTKILEFYPNGAFFQPCYQRLSEVCFLDHTVMYLDFRNKADITLGINALTDMLNKFLC